MSFTTVGFIVFGVWILIGITTSFAMGRRGHHLFSWGLLGAVFGPLVLPLALVAVVDERHARSNVLRGGGRGPGPLSVLVGIDGSEESTAALRTAIVLFGAGLKRLTLAKVVDFETAQGGLPNGEQRAADDLNRHAAMVGTPRPETLLLGGRPADALVEAALDGGYHLLVVGSRGRGAAKALLGSVAERLAANGRMPVLVVGKDALPVGLMTTRATAAVA
jgi:nucleotide-binding universal stress UspA family protein